MKIAICDDEPSCIDQLQKLIETYCTDRRFVCSCSVFSDPVSFEQSELDSYDVVFLDANLGEASGIEAAKVLRTINKTAVLVYVSAFVEYAPMGYRVDAFRYLMKNDLDHTFFDCMDEIMGRLELNIKRLLISTTDGLVQVVISDLVFIESFHHQILFHMSDGSVMESKQHTLSELSSFLAPHHFIRIHKSFLVNPEQIANIKNRVATLYNGETLNCGKTDYAETVRAFMLWKGGI